ncbi:MAG: sodium-dependent transporter [Candidatus Krumholzibacteria bacterium]|nr:sodium-dependent transporter [Candidatus Krumholzibacteria bacterium]MDP6668345.1 sodium-dependent transporter [Candidatus Krumholzibacteria bacterium]MDP7022202.1 sodium-dependent transporter [Candidatus Krumholzibacteria bacterium]
MKESRGQWSGRMGFVLAAAGSAVGLGNLWKFPYITYENGGGAFVLVYIAAVILIGAPVMIAEILLGRRSQRSPVGAFLSLAGKNRAWGGVGFLGVLTGFVILSYYSVVAGWTLRYIAMAFSGGLGELAGNPAHLQDFFGGFLSNGPQQIFFLFLFMSMTVTVVILGVQKGIERAAKFLMPVLFAILGVLVIYSFSTPGFSKAVTFLFRPNFSELTTGAVLEALGHSFFTLSLGMGAMLTYGSYMRKKDSIPRAAITITFLDTLIAIMACLIMFSIIFSFDFEVKKSATILFTTLPTVFFKLPGGAMISGLFYLLVAFAALTSTISLMEVVSSYAIDELGWERRRATLSMGAAIFVFGVLSALSLGGNKTLSGINLIGKESTAGVFGTLDYLASNWFLPVGGFFIALFVGWFLGRKDSTEELEEGHGEMPSYGIWRFLLRFAAPLVIGAIIVSVILGREYQ